VEAKISSERQLNCGSDGSTPIARVVTKRRSTGNERGWGLMASGESILECDDRKMPTTTRAAKTAFYDIHMDYRGGASGYEIENLDALQSNREGLSAIPPWPNGYGKLPGW
jgi:hypothetical protein